MDATQSNISAEAPRFAHRLEAWGAALFFTVFGLLPLDCASAVGGTLARRIGPFLGISKCARINLRRALPELSETEIAGVIAGIWDNLGRVAAEYPHLQKIRAFESGGHVETRGFEHIGRAVAAGRMIVFSGHIANWEIGSLAGVQYGISRGTDLSRRQQSAGRPLDSASARRSRRVHPEGSRRRAARDCSAQSRRAFGPCSPIRK
jgi:lauroyl/myristoyl acyltransferase